MGKNIRKVFAPSGPAASGAQYWDHLWAQSNLHEDALTMWERPGPIVRELLRHVPAQGSVLEAGCGSGAVAALLERQGCRVTALDFAVPTLSGIRRVSPLMTLVAGDLRRLPFADAAFDCVVSLGALEHIEEGFGPALSEHRRVLRQGGRLFLTIPRLSVLKSVNDTIGLRMGRRTIYLSRRGRFVERRATMSRQPSQHAFVQYELPNRVIAAYVSRSGFKVQRVASLLNNAGIGESRFVRKRSRSNTDAAGSETRATSVQSAGSHDSVMRTVKRAVLAEEADSLATRLVVGGSRWMLGHMCLVVGEAV